MNGNWHAATAFTLLLALGSSCASSESAPAAGQSSEDVTDTSATAGDGSAEVPPSSNPGGDRESTDTGASSTTTEVLPVQSPPRPTLVVHGSDGDIGLEPYTSCWPMDFGSGVPATECFDGFPPDPLPLIGESSGTIGFDFPLPGWRFGAGIRTAADDQLSTMPVREIAPGTWEIDVADRTGTSVIELGGSGPEGDYHVAFEVELTADP